MMTGIDGKNYLYILKKASIMYQLILTTGYAAHFTQAIIGNYNYFHEGDDLIGYRTNR